MPEGLGGVSFYSVSVLCNLLLCLDAPDPLRGPYFEKLPFYRFDYLLFVAQVAEPRTRSQSETRG